MITLIYNPVAQDTVTRPMAQAICLARGGEPVKYTNRGQEKVLFWDEQMALEIGPLERADNGEKVTPKQAVQMARSGDIQVRVDANDVQVLITRKTTVEQAIAQFKQKNERRVEKLLKEMAKQHQRS